MENENQPTPEHLSSLYPNHQIAWDASSLKPLKTCPRLYQLSILQGWRKKDQSIHLTFGIAYHKLLETYDKLRNEGNSHEVSLRLVVRKWHEIAGDWESEDTKKNKVTLLRSVIWYLDEFKTDPLKTYILQSGKPAVEILYKYETEEVSRLTNEPYIFCGTFDRLVRVLSGQLYILDRKTTGGQLGDHYFMNFTPDTQISGYTLSGKVVFEEPVAGIIIDAAQVLVGSTKFARGFVLRTTGQLKEWYDDTMISIREAEVYAEKNYWPMRDTSCGMYGGCDFRPVCSRDPAVREAILKTNYQQQFWNPLEARE